MIFHPTTPLCSIKVASFDQARRKLTCLTLAAGAARLARSTLVHMPEQPTCEMTQPGPRELGRWRLWTAVSPGARQLDNQSGERAVEFQKVAVQAGLPTLNCNYSGLWSPESTSWSRLMRCRGVFTGTAGTINTGVSGRRCEAVGSGENQDSAVG